MSQKLPVRPRRAAAYCRVSTTADLQDGSFETQCRYYREKIKRAPDMELVNVYGDHGKSGRDMTKRTALRQMLQDCQDGKIDLILTKSISRFSRNLAECISTIRHLQQLQIPIIFEREALNTGDERNELYLCILAAIAQEESRHISSRIAWSRRERALAGVPYGAVSYGFQGGKAENHIWKVKEAEARRVRLAFEMAARGECYMEIRAALQKMENEEGTGKVWSQYNLGYLLHNVYYTGDYIVNKTCEIETERGRRKIKNKGQREQFYIEGHHEALVSKETFGQVQRLMEAGLLNSRKQRAGRVNGYGNERDGI